ncbi:hypothetical protein B0O99DRAFT_646225 [Bisporella sp. PMI_857]|nr:hypothetical protein B0O99DRAFT_646225 [Bisporella sp. PMI_857]
MPIKRLSLWQSRSMLKLEVVPGQVKQISMMHGLTATTLVLTLNNGRLPYTFKSSGATKSTLYCSPRLSQGPQEQDNPSHSVQKSITSPIMQRPHTLPGKVAIPPIRPSQILPSARKARKSVVKMLASHAFMEMGNVTRSKNSFRQYHFDVVEALRLIRFDVSLTSDDIWPALDKVLEMNPVPLESEKNPEPFGSSGCPSSSSSERHSEQSDNVDHIMLDDINLLD